MNEDFNLEKMEKFYPLVKKTQELKLTIIHNYINYYTSDDEERQMLYRNSFFYVLENESNELEHVENCL
jgi:hypothetical protein